jgi:hypothetical protein
VSVAAGSDVNAVRTALKSVTKTQKKSAVAACRQYSGGIAGNRSITGKIVGKIGKG